MKRIYLSDYDGLQETCRLLEINGTEPGNISELLDGIHFCTVDSSHTDMYNPCKIPVKGYNYSFTKSLLWEVHDWEKFSEIVGCKQIWNLGCYLAPTRLGGINILTGRDVLPITCYKQATGIIGVTGEPMPNTMNMNMFNMYNPKPIDLGPYSAPFRSMMIRLQAMISPDAIQGVSRFPNLYFTGIIAD